MASMTAFVESLVVTITTPSLSSGSAIKVVAKP